ncbi:MAG: hypothetical protein LBT32_06420 [Peptococcaceae bacterium]|jgi:hypothetical protein|nr:hypothetical protein [Peptococcaceae bacterium]
MKFSSEIVRDDFSVARNRALELPQTDQEALLLLCYLVRDEYQLEHHSEAVAYMRKVLQYPARIRELWRQERYQFMPLVFAMLVVASENRRGFSRRQIYQTLILPFREIDPEDQGIPLLELVYRLFFDYREEVFLRDLPEALETARRCPEYYNEAPPMVRLKLYTLAARAYWRRGAVPMALEFMREGYRYRLRACSAEDVRLFLRCLRGKETSLQTELLSRGLDVQQPEILRMLLDTTRLPMHRELHAYYLDKQLSSEPPSHGSVLYQLLLSGQYDQLRSALAALPLNDYYREFVTGYLFLLVVCSGDEGCYRRHAATLRDVSTLLDAFFTGSTLPELSREESKWLMFYPWIALLAGREIAERFLRVFSVADPRMCYWIRARHLVENAEYAALAAEAPEGIAPLDDECRMLYVEALLRTGRDQEALAQIRSLLAGEILTEELLHQLRVISECSGECGLPARALYAEYRAVWDKIIELEDVIHTQLAFRRVAQQDEKAWRALSRQAFQQLLDRDQALPRCTRLLRLSRQAAVIYEQQGCIPEALACYQLTLAQDYAAEESLNNLSRIFSRLGNHTLAEFLGTKGARAFPKGRIG